MTIEIRQLVIRATVEPSGAVERERESADSIGTPELCKSGGGSGSPSIGQDALVAACVREVQRALRRYRGR